jgi:hypothetical protein
MQRPAARRVTIVSRVDTDFPSAQQNHTGPASPKSWNARSIAVLPAPHMPVRIVVGEEDYATPLAMSEALHRAS